MKCSLVLILLLGATQVSAMANRQQWRAKTQELIQQSADVLDRGISPKVGTGSLVVFMKPGCPLANLYSGRLGEFSKDFPSLNIIGVVVAGESRAEFVKDWTRSRNFPFKVVRSENQWVDHFQASVSPEAFLLDSLNEIVYRGKIDDQFQPGRPNLSAPTLHYVRERLEKLSKGEPLVPSFTLAKGCLFSVKDVSFNETIAPMIYGKCTHCHRPFDIQSQIPFTRFEEIADWAPTMLERITERYMPPWRAHHGFGDFSNDVGLTVNEMWSFASWVDQEMPVEANPLTAPKKLLQSQWRIGEPDAVLGMLPEGESYTVPKEGVLPYQHFDVTSPFEEDKWVLATEVRPGVPEVVHHINVFIIPPQTEGTLARILKRRGAIARLKARGQTVDPESVGRALDLYGYKLEKRIWFLSDFNPAESVTAFPEGKGLLLKKGSRFVFEVHYTPNGYQEMKDRSLIAFKFAKEIPKDWRTKEPITRTGGKLGEIEIAPMSKKTLKFELPIYLDADLHSLKPHMHYRGKSFAADLVSPEGESKRILFLPQWDYDFQLPYLFSTPVFMAAGSKLVLTYEWDNTPENKNITPQQANEVSNFGFQTSDEMCMAFPTYTYRSTNIQEIREAENRLEQAIISQVRLPKANFDESEDSED